MKNCLSSKLLSLYALALLSGIAIGLFQPIISIHMATYGVSNSLIGANASVFFLCLVIAAPIVQKMLVYIGIKHMMILGLMITGGSVVSLAFIHDTLLWFVARALMGIGVSFYTISAQSALNRYSMDSSKAIVTGIYGFAFGVGLSIGPVLGGVLYSIGPAVAFEVGAAIILSGVLLTVLIPNDKFSSCKINSQLMKRILIPLYAVFAYGFAEATILSIYPIFLSQHNYDVLQSSLVLGAFVVGGIISTLPVSYYAEKKGCVHTLSLCGLVGIFAILLLVFASNHYLSIALAVLVGASLGPVYSVSLALVGKSLADHSLHIGSAMFLIAFGLGSTLGPWLSALVTDQVGDNFIFGLTIMLFITLLIQMNIKEKKYVQ